MSVIEETVEITDEGKVTYSGREKPQRESKLSEIVTKVSDPNVPVAEISRLITIEIASVLEEQCNAMNDPTFSYKARAYNDMVKSLRELGKQLNDTDLLSKKDVLNWEGPKFQFVMTELFNELKKGITEVGVDDTLTTSILKQFRDNLRTSEERIRREVEKIDSSVK